VFAARLDLTGRSICDPEPMPSVSIDRRSIWWVSARSGFSAALAGLAASLVVVVICWLPDAGVSGRPTSAIKAGILAFLTAQGGGLTLNGVSVGFVPLAMTAVVAVIAWRAGRTLADAAGELTDRGELLTALSVQTTAYAACCTVLVPLSRLGTTHVSLPGTLFASGVLFWVVSGSAFAVHTPIGEQILATTPDTVLRGVRAASGAVGCYLLAGTLLSLGSLVLHASQVMNLSRQVGGGLSGFPIMVLGVVSAPNAVVAGSSYLAGPGFAVGSDTSVNAFSTSHGVLPAFPLLGAVPDGHGADPAVLALMAFTALAAATAAAVLVRRTGAAGLGSWSAGVGAAAGCTGVAMALLGWLAGGSAGPGRLHVVGASPWQLAIATGGAVAIIGEAVVLGYWGWLWLSDRTHESAAEPERELAGSRR
jgi:Family of unknown function (DUF6350)